MQKKPTSIHVRLRQLSIIGIVLVTTLSVQMSGAATDPSLVCKIYLPVITTGELCPAWVHARYVTTGPDGKQYPTWHPPIDPEFGCLFGHEHGADPRTSHADASMPAFGYAAALMG